MQAFSDVLIKAFRIQGRKLFHFSPPERADDFKVNIYDLSYVYSKGNGEENATTCSAFQNPVGWNTARHCHASAGVRRTVRVRYLCSYRRITAQNITPYGYPSRVWASSGSSGRQMDSLSSVTSYSCVGRWDNHDVLAVPSGRCAGMVGKVGLPLLLRKENIFT